MNPVQFMLTFVAVIVKSQNNHAPQGQILGAFLPGLGTFLTSQQQHLPVYNGRLAREVVNPNDLPDPGPKCSYVQMKGDSIPGKIHHQSS